MEQANTSGAPSSVRSGTPVFSERKLRRQGSEAVAFAAVVDIRPAFHARQASSRYARATSRGGRITAGTSEMGVDLTTRYNLSSRSMFDRCSL